MRRLLLTPLVLAAVACAAVEEPQVTMPPPPVEEIAPAPAPEPAYVPPPPRVRREGATTIYGYDPNRTYPVTVRPGHITVLQMGKGEEITRQPIIGDPDPARWAVDITRGALDSIALRCAEAKRATNMLVTTNAADYQLDLGCKDGGWMPRVRWAYPETVKPVQRVRAAMAGCDPMNSRSYEITGDAPWRPQVVLDGAGKTCIGFPPRLGPTGAPALFSITDAGRAPLSFRIKGRWFEVDSLITTAELVLDGQTVRIRRAG